MFSWKIGDNSNPVERVYILSFLLVIVLAITLYNTSEATSAAVDPVEPTYGSVHRWVVVDTTATTARLQLQTLAQIPVRNSYSVDVSTTIFPPLSGTVTLYPEYFIDQGATQFTLHSLEAQIAVSCESTGSITHVDTVTEPDFDSYNLSAGFLAGSTFQTRVDLPTAPTTVTGTEWMPVVTTTFDKSADCELKLPERVNPSSVFDSTYTHTIGATDSQGNTLDNNKAIYADPQVEDHGMKMRLKPVHLDSNGNWVESRDGISADGKFLNLCIQLARQSYMGTREVPLSGLNFRLRHNPGQLQPIPIITRLPVNEGLLFNNYVADTTGSISGVTSINVEGAANGDPIPDVYHFVGDDYEDIVCLQFTLIVPLSEYPFVDEMVDDFENYNPACLAVEFNGTYVGHFPPTFISIRWV